MSNNYNTSSEIVTQLLNGIHPLSLEMKKYKATPWCKCDIDKKPNGQSCETCNPPKKTKEEQGIQSHGGDLFEHSQWCALYLAMMYSNPNTTPGYPVLHSLLKDAVDSELLKTELLKKYISNYKNKRYEFIKLCGFLHDIGKGGDGIFDLYADNKYFDKDKNQKTDNYHPIRSAEYILNPGEKYNGLLKTVLDHILNSYLNPILARKLMAFFCAIHWEFGKMNLTDNDPNKLSASDYVNFIDKNIHLYITNDNITPENKEIIKKERFILFKICMAISCADVACAYNKELIDNYSNKIIDGITIAPMTHESNGGAWTNYEFNINHPKYINEVLPLIQNTSTGGKKRTCKKPKQKRKMRKTKKAKKARRPRKNITSQKRF